MYAIRGNCDKLCMLSFSIRVFLMSQKINLLQMGIECNGEKYEVYQQTGLDVNDSFSVVDARRSASGSKSDY